MLPAWFALDIGRLLSSSLALLADPCNRKAKVHDRTVVLAAQLSRVGYNSARKFETSAIAPGISRLPQ